MPNSSSRYFKVELVYLARVANLREKLNSEFNRNFDSRSFDEGWEKTFSNVKKRADSYSN